MTWGADLAWFEALAAEGEEVEALKSRPVLPNWLSFEWQAYADLRSDRPVGLDVGQIPWTAIRRYAMANGIANIDEIEQFAALMRAMESAEAEHGVQSRNRRDNRS